LQKLQQDSLKALIKLDILRWNEMYPVLMQSRIIMKGSEAEMSSGYVMGLRDAVMGLNAVLKWQPLKARSVFGEKCFIHPVK